MSMPTWTVELHSHTIYSKDSLTGLDKIQDICRKRNIDKIAITDHNTARGALELARMFPMLIIPGEEIMTTKGELLAWYISEEVPPFLSPSETIELLKQQGAVIGVAHPFDRYRKGAWEEHDLLEIVADIDAIEVFNSRCLRSDDNDRALEFAQQHNKLMTCGSDAHVKREYGRAVIKCRPFANSAAGLRQALQETSRQEVLSGALVHFSSTYAKWIKKAIPALRA